MGFGADGVSGGIGDDGNSGGGWGFGGDSYGMDSTSSVGDSGGYSMHDQAMAGLSGPEAAALGPGGVSAAADVAGAGGGVDAGSGTIMDAMGNIYGISPRTGTYGRLGARSLTGHGTMTTALGWGFKGFGGMKGVSSLSDPSNPAHSAYVQAQQNTLTQAQAAFSELKQPFHKAVAAANLPASYRDQLISAFQENPFDKSIPSEFTANVNMDAMEESLATLNGAIGDLVDIGLLGVDSLKTPETAFTDLHHAGLTSYNAETGQMELSRAGMAGEFAQNFSGQVLGAALKVGSSFMGGIFGIVADIMSELAMAPGQGTLTGFGNMVGTFNDAQIAGLNTGSVPSSQATSSQGGAVSVPQVAIQTGYTPAPSNYAAATPKAKAATGVYGFGAPQAMAIPMNYGQDHGRYL